MTRFVLFAMLLTACATGTESTSSTDTLATETDTVASGMLSADKTVEGPGDTTIYLADITSNFENAQLDYTTAYVYRRAGLHVYESLEDVGDTTKALDLIPFGTALTLGAPLVNNDPDNKIEYEGFKGRYVAIKTYGTERYVFSGYLTSFPPPGEKHNLVDYFREHFHLLTAPTRVQSKDTTDFETGSSYSITYQFEGEISVNESGYYEGYSTFVTLPADCSMQQAFLLLRSFKIFEDFDKSFAGYPGDDYSSKLEEYLEAKTEVNNGEIVKIILVDTSGCYDETVVQKDNDRIQIGSGGGC